MVGHIFMKFWYWGILLKFVNTFYFWSKSDKMMGPLHEHLHVFLCTEVSGWKILRLCWLPSLYLSWQTCHNCYSVCSFPNLLITNYNQEEQQSCFQSRVDYFLILVQSFSKVFWQFEKYDLVTLYCCSTGYFECYGFSEPI